MHQKQSSIQTSALKKKGLRQCLPRPLKSTMIQTSALKKKGLRPNSPFVKRRTTIQTSALKKKGLRRYFVTLVERKRYSNVRPEEEGIKT